MQPCSAGYESREMEKYLVRVRVLGLGLGLGLGSFREGAEDV